MHSFLSKLVMLGVVAGGFFLTGDLAGLLDRGRGLVERSTVPGSATEAIQAEASHSAPIAPFAPTAAPAPAAPAITPPPATPAVSEAEAHAETKGQPGAQTASPRIPMPAMLLESVDLASLPAGARVLVLAGRHVIALDVVDGPAGEVLEHAHAVHPDRLVTIASAASPRRLTVLGSTAAARDGTRLLGRATGRITRGEWLQLQPADAKLSASGPESVGPIDALGLE